MNILENFVKNSNYEACGDLVEKLNNPSFSALMLKVLGDKYNRVKKDRIRFKLMCNWCTSKELCDEWNKMSKGDRTWNNIEITWEDEYIDYYVIINKPGKDDFYIPSRTIIFQMEPWCNEEYQTWGVKTWGEWSVPDEGKFLSVKTAKNQYTNCYWQLNTTYTEFKTGIVPKSKGHIMSSICSPKYQDPGHKLRVDFIKYLEQKGDIVMHIYGYDNTHNFKNYTGRCPDNDKNMGIKPYKYYFIAENNKERNYVTEKLWEPILSECLCFYWGCPNISDYIDDRAYVVLDLEDLEKSYEIVKEAISNNLWEERIDIIRKEKQKILDYYNFFPTLERIITNELRLPLHPTNEQILYHKYFSDTLSMTLNKVCFVEGEKEYSTREGYDMVFIFGKNENKDKMVRYINYSEPHKLVDLYKKYNENVEVTHIN
jgi:hypothetical protein